MLKEIIDKTALREELATLLVDHEIKIEGEDFNRPWGGFFVMDEANLEEFVKLFFPELKHALESNVKWSPKILFVAPYQKLSWQYHHRRSEIWCVVKGKVGIVRSKSDELKAQEILMEGDRVEIEQGERHRLVGLDQWSVIAEIWQHSDPNNPSDELDIVRLEDSYGRN